MPELLDDLLKHALIGTSRAAPLAPPTASGPLGDALRALPPSPPEQLLLSAAALATAYARCGQVPVPSDAQVPLAERESLAVCSPVAGHILSLLLAPSPPYAAQQLIQEWLTHAAGGRRRVPHRLLPRLLDYVASHRPIRPLVSQTIGARGQWLTRLNPGWQFAASDEGAPTNSWDTATRDQRKTILQQIRQSTPAHAIALLESTWNEDPAEDRATFLEILTTGLGAHDEPFLESALNDKSKRVRATAADLLARLPQSAFIQRMTDRATPLLQYVPTQAAALLKLKKPKPARIEVSLPPEPLDPLLLRDNVSEKASESIGPRQWWLLQILGCVPPATWSTRWQITPSECIAAASANKEFGDLLLRAWHEAAARHPDPEWITALLTADADAGRTGRGDSRDASLLGTLAPARQLRLAARILEARKGIEPLAFVLRAITCPLDRQLSTVAIETLESHVSANPIGYDYQLSSLLDPLALRLPPDLHDRLATLWAGDRWEAQRSTLDRFFQTLSLRRDMNREFAP